jgi:YrbI family 3-deoxy-D-manno-octulosonate 8-phosphate phosphatase
LKASRGTKGRRSKLRTKSARPALLVFDFDGVLTDNHVWVFANGDEAVACNRSDGLAFDILRASNVRTLILTTERHSVVLARANKLRCEVLNAVRDKASALRRYCSEAGVALNDVMYVGNDTNDLAAMRLVGWAACPSDAHPEVRRHCRVVLQSRGGAGVAREIVEQVLGLRFDETTLVEDGP